MGGSAPEGCEIDHEITIVHVVILLGMTSNDKSGDKQNIVYGYGYPK